MNGRFPAEFRSGNFSLAITPFCDSHWRAVRARFEEKYLLVAVMSAIQLSAKKWSEINTPPCSIEEMNATVKLGGNCYPCFWGVSFIDELKGFVEYPPAWSRPTPVAEAAVPESPAPP